MRGAPAAIALALKCQRKTGQVDMQWYRPISQTSLENVHLNIEQPMWQAHSTTWTSAAELMWCTTPLAVRQDVGKQQAPSVPAICPNGTTYHLHWNSHFDLPSMQGSREDIENPADGCRVLTAINNPEGVFNRLMAFCLSASPPVSTVWAGKGCCDAVLLCTLFILTACSFQCSAACFSASFPEAAQEHARNSLTYHHNT